MKAVQHVEYNDDGTWKFALVTGTGPSGPGNLNGLFNTDGGRFEPFHDAPRGDDSGCWRDPA